jgi:uncharacterized coiled-coil DUF342 family protein
MEKDRMSARKPPKAKEDLETIKQEILYELHVFHMDVVGHLRRVQEGINKFSDRLDIFHEEIKQTIDNSFQKVMGAITDLTNNIDVFREEIKAKIREISSI